MIVDFHVHCFPDNVAANAIPKLAACAGVAARLNGTITDLEKSMDRNGIDVSVVLSIATKPSQMNAINHWAAEVQRKNIFCFGSIHPEGDEWKQELKRMKHSGLKGVKLHPDYQNFFVDDPQMYPIYEEIFALDLILLLHAGLDIGLPEPTRCTPERLAEVIRLFPGGRVVAAHMGGFQYWDDVETYLVGKDLYFDTSYSLGWMPEEQMKRMVKNHGYDKILFATDSPWADQGEEIHKLRSLGLDDAVMNAILGRNAIRLLNQ